MESDTKEDVLMPEMKHSPHSIKSIKLGNDQKNQIGNNTERKCINLVSSDEESVKPIQMNLVDETFPKRPVPHKQGKFSFGWKKTSGKHVNAKVHTVNENIVNKSVESTKKVPNIVNKNLLHSLSNVQFKHNFQDMKENFPKDRCETHRIGHVQINSYSKTDTQNHNLESATTHFFKPSFELQTGQTDALLDLHPHSCNFTPKVKPHAGDLVQSTILDILDKSLPVGRIKEAHWNKASLSQDQSSIKNPAGRETVTTTTLTENLPNPTVQNCFQIPPTSYDYIPSQVLNSSSTSTPHSYYPVHGHHLFIPPSANVLEDPVSAFEAAMEILDKKKKEHQLKERRRASPESDNRKRIQRSPHRRERHHKHRSRDYSPLQKRSHHSKNRHRSPSRRHSTHNSDSKSPPPKRSKMLDLRDKINSRSPSPKTSIIGDLRDKINSRSPSPEKSKIGDLRNKINSRSPSPEKSKKVNLRNKINSGGAHKRKKKVAKSRTPSPADYSKLNDNQSQSMIKSKLTKLSLGSLKSLRTSLLNELLEEPLIDLLDEPDSPNQSAESKLDTLPSKVSANLLKKNVTLEPNESVSDQQPSESGCVSQVPHRESPVKESSGESQASIQPMKAQPKEPSVEFISSGEFEEFYFHSSILPVDTHLTEFLIQEKFSKRALSILPAGQSFKVSPVLLEESKTSKYGESLLHQQTGESLLPIMTKKSSGIYCSEVLKEKNSSELPQQILNDKINFCLTPFLKLEWQIMKKSDIFPSNEFDNSSLSEQSDETLTPIVKLDWKLEYQEMISSKLPEVNITSELKEPIQLSELPLPVPRSNVVNTSSASEDREPSTSGLSLIRESYSLGIVDHPLVISTLGESVSSVQNSVIYSSGNPLSGKFPSSALPPLMSEVPVGSLINLEVPVGSLRNPEVPMGSLINPEVPVGSLINPNILNCGLCEKTCKRSVVLPCCLAQACNGCAVSAITKNRMCWGCQKPAKSTKELNQDKVLREAIEWFGKNGTIKREHGESLIMRRKFIIERMEKLSKVKKKTNGVAYCKDTEVRSRGKNKRTKAESVSNYALSRKRRNEKDDSDYKKPEKRSHCRMPDDNDNDRKKSGRKQKLPDETKRLTKKPENSTDPEEVSVITRVKRKLLERIESLQNDQERLCLAKSEFQNPICSDPTINLTFHGYRRKKLLVMQDENVDSFYDFYTNPEVVKVGQVKSEERQMFYLKAGNTISMPGFKKVFKMDRVQNNAPEEEIKEIVRAEEFKVLLENEFQKNNKPLTKSKRSSKNDKFKTRFSHFQAVHSEAINFLQFYKSEFERRQVEEIVYLENLYKKCAVFYGKTEPIFCKSCNVNHKF